MLRVAVQVMESGRLLAKRLAAHAAQVSDEVTAAVVAEQTSRSTMRLRASLLAALRVSV
jgi:hypothetical protein